MSNLQIIDNEAASSAFGKINAALKHAQVDWILADSFAAGDVVNKDGVVYEANDVIPGSTAFVEGTVGATWKQRIKSDIDGRGWEMIHDGFYSQGAPLIVSNGQRVKLTNDGTGGLTNVGNLPAGFPPLYDLTENEIVPPNNIGDILKYRITMQMTPHNANVVATVEFQIEDAPPVVTGISTVTFPDTDERHIHLYTTTFTLANFIANNGALYVSSNGGHVDIYDLKIFIERSYVGK